MTAPQSVGIWVCPSGRHIALDKTAGQGGLPVTGVCDALDNTPLCHGNDRLCDDRGMTLRTYILPESAD